VKANRAKEVGESGPPTKLQLSKVPTVQEIATSTAAAIGLALSIYNTIQARRDKRPKLQVRVSFGAIAYGPELSNQKIFFEVGNPWDKPITLSSMSIPLPGKRSMAFLHLEGENEMPVLLTPGMSTRFWLNANELEAETIKAGIGYHGSFQVMARDGLGNEHLSKIVSFKPA
jgi:hypothetical protein